MSRMGHNAAQMRDVAQNRKRELLSARALMGGNKDSNGRSGRERPSSW